MSPKFALIPLSTQQARAPQTRNHKQQPRDHGRVQYNSPPPGRGHDRQRKVYHALRKVVWAHQQVKCGVRRDGVFLQRSQVNVTVMLRPGSENKEDNSKERFRAGGADKIVNAREREIELVNRNCGDPSRSVPSVARHARRGGRKPVPSTQTAIHMIT